MYSNLNSDTRCKLQQSSSVYLFEMYIINLAKDNHNDGLIIIDDSFVVK